MCEKGRDFEVYNYGYECWRTPPGTFEGINYRYLLEKNPLILLKKNPLIIIGCNPSTAKEDKLDPTMRKVSQFCQRNGYNGYIMLNLYPQIASDVEALPPDITSHIDHIKRFHNININIIKKTLKKYKNSDVLFAFGKLITKRNYLYDPCYVDIRNLVRISINKNKIKKLAKRNIETNEIEQFAYPPHFGNRMFYGNGINNAELVEFNIKEYDEYIIEVIEKLELKNQKKAK